VIFKESIKQYAENFKTSLGFALLLVSVLFFVLSQNFFVSSGSIFIDFNILKSNPIDFLILLLIVVIFEFLYAIMITLIVFAVRKSMSKVRVQYYLAEKIQKFAFKLFLVFIVFTFLSLLLQILLPLLGIPIAVVNSIILLASLLLLFLPQAIVIDETGIRSSIIASAEFLRKHLKESLQIIVLGVVMLIALGIIEYILDLISLTGNFVTLLFSLVIIVPFLEIVKSVIFMHKFELVKSVHREIVPKTEKPLSTDVNQV